MANQTIEINVYIVGKKNEPSFIQKEQGLRIPKCDDVFALRPLLTDDKKPKRYYAITHIASGGSLGTFYSRATAASVARIFYALVGDEGRDYFKAMTADDDLHIDKSVVPIPVGKWLSNCSRFDCVEDFSGNNTAMFTAGRRGPIPEEHIFNVAHWEAKNGRIPGITGQNRATVDRASGLASVLDPLEIHNRAAGKFPDVVAIIRVGDFYEIFGPNAEKVAKTLGMVVTHRGDLAMTGFPYHQIENYLMKLTKEGFRVSVYERKGGAS